MEREYKTKLYHRNVCWFKKFDGICNLMLKSRPVIYSKHLYTRSEDKHIDMDYIEKMLSELQNGKRKYTVFEVDTSKYIEKFVIRTKYDEVRDICIVFQNKYDEDKKEPYLFIKTAWLNNTKDRHLTLDADKYSKDIEFVYER